MYLHSAYKGTLHWFKAVFSHRFLINDFATGLRWKYSLNTLGHKTIQQNFSGNNLNFLKNNYYRYISSQTDLFSTCFLIWPIWCRKNNFKTLDVHILVKCRRQIRLRHPQGGPDTHDDPHETGAARTAARPLIVQKNHLETIKSLSMSDYYKFFFLQKVINNNRLVK